MWELDYKESWMPENWCFLTMVLEKTLESPLDCKEIQPVHPKGDQSWVFIGRTDIEAEAPILWPPGVKSRVIWKDPDAGKDWGQEEKGTTEDEMVGWHHRLDGHESEQAPGVGDGQGTLLCCSAWGHKELHPTDWLNWTELIATSSSSVNLRFLIVLLNPDTASCCSKPIKRQGWFWMLATRGSGRCLSGGRLPTSPQLTISGQELF